MSIAIDGGEAEGASPASPPARRAARLRVTGRVQGVGYRDWLVGQAVALGLAGWVRNRPDGSVEAHAEGPAAALDQLAERCRRGPRLARVDGVQVSDLPPEGHAGFTRRPTA